VALVDDDEESGVVTVQDEDDGEDSMFDIFIVGLVYVMWYGGLFLL